MKVIRKTLSSMYGISGLPAVLALVLTAVELGGVTRAFLAREVEE